MNNRLAINSIMVRVHKQNVKDLGSIVVVSEEVNQNRGEVVLLPSIITKDFEVYKEVLENISIGDFVIFPSKSRIELVKENSEYRYLMVPLDQIVLIEKSNQLT